LVLTTNPTFTGCIIVVRPVGMLNTTDEAGDDPKILGVPVKDPRFKEVSDLSQVPNYILLEIEDFFLNYKKLEPKKTVRIKGWNNMKKVEEAILTVFAFMMKNS
jgi:inorganic pyrophosphatase